MSIKKLLLIILSLIIIGVIGYVVLLLISADNKVSQGSSGEAVDVLSVGSHWAHPVIHNGVLYLRHGEALLAYDIREK